MAHHAQTIPDPVHSSNPSLRLYVGKVMHARLKPVAHRFTYKVFNILVDLDQLDLADGQSSLLSVNRWNLLSFHEKDHGKRDGSSLRDYADEMLKGADLPPAERIRILCYPRVLGYTFNPLTVYYCYDNEDRLTAFIYQVNNTFGERHSYVEPIATEEVSSAGVRQTTDKLFYVSPFMNMEMTYHFRMSVPGTKIKQRILEHDPEGPILAATLSLSERPANGWGFIKALLQTKGLTWKVTLGIHYEALKLWLKGIKLTTRPAAPATESFATGKSMRLNEKRSTSA